MRATCSRAATSASEQNHNLQTLPPPSPSPDVDRSVTQPAPRDRLGSHHTPGTPNTAEDGRENAQAPGRPSQRPSDSVGSTPRGGTRLVWNAAAPPLHRGSPPLESRTRYTSAARGRLRCCQASSERIRGTPGGGGGGGGPETSGALWRPDPEKIEERFGRLGGKAGRAADSFPYVSNPSRGNIYFIFTNGSKGFKTSCNNTLD